MDALPSNKEITKAIQQLNNSAAGASSIRAEVFKALAFEPDTFAIICKFICNFWSFKKQPNEFDFGKLSILPKKGDLSLPGNYRSIMMLEVGQKIISNIMQMRLPPPPG
eukprot:15337003-Ditylum_brightwellii.AAC.1